MPTSLIEGNSLLAIDVGATTTRALFFDVVEDRYRFIAMGQAPTTLGAPLNNIGYGVQQAVENLQISIDRTFLDAEGRLILPSLPEGAGVDACVSTISAGPAFKAVLVGLLEDVSLDSAQRLARTTYARVVETIGLNDRRKPHEQIDDILFHNPDVIIITGGTEAGATRSLTAAMEMVGLACYVAPQDKRPAVLFAGNSAVAGEAAASFKGLTPSLKISPNIRPSLDQEDLGPAQRHLAEIFSERRRQQTPGVEDLIGWTGDVMPTVYASGRMLKFLGNLFGGTNKGVFSVNVGASSLAMGASFDGDLHQRVFSNLGLGEPASGLLRLTSAEEIMQWLPIDMPVDYLKDYLFTKSLYPATVPAAAEDLVIEQAIARQMMRLAIAEFTAALPKARQGRGGVLPAFEPILASGAVFSNAPSLGHGLLMLLDALEPVGVTRLVLDNNDLMPALGAAADKNTILPVHVMESWAFSTLASVISPVSNANYGAPILRVRMVDKNNNESKIEVKQGALDVLPLNTGQSARLELTPIGRTDVGFGPGRPGKLDVNGGALGLVIDARGRPLRLPTDAVRRRELIKKWLYTVGG